MLITAPSSAYSDRFLPAGVQPAQRSQLLEMARGFSIAHDSELVLCTHFLPGIDLAVSAFSDDWSSLPAHPDESASRLGEVSDLLEPSLHQMPFRPDWRRAVLSFGLIRWWPVAIRAKAAHALGPFCVVLEGNDSGAPNVFRPKRLVLAG